MHFLQHKLSYHPEIAQLFAAISHQPWAMLLDSGRPESEYGRYDIIVADPFITLRSFEQASDGSIQTEIVQNGISTFSHEDPFVILKQLLAPYQATVRDVPFTGGAVGYFGYDLARQVEKLPNIAQKNLALPHMMIGIYDWAVVVDHLDKTANLVSNSFHPSTQGKWPDLCAMFDAPATAHESRFELTSAVSSNMDFAHYATAFNQIKRYIAEGDCYQVNLAQRFSASAKGDGWPAYLKLKAISPAPFMAYLNFGDVQVLSGSPERFIQLTDGHVETRPIKGTRPRSDDPALDQQHAQDLQNSIKDRAENLMIVDLLRNDIGKNCAIGSVKADQLFQLQSFANVHHLVSIITGKLKEGRTAIDLLRGCFPGGSITGAPKLRAMQIIEELEPHRRGVYCGAIGYIGFDGNMDTNIAIRTAVYANKNTPTHQSVPSNNHAIDREISFYAGGGIVADSMLEKEYTETLDKASSMMKTMQSFRC